MLKFGQAVVKNRFIILTIAILLLIPSVLGIINTRVNYDILDYLPTDMDTVKGQNILLDDFGKGAFSLVIVDGMKPYQISNLIEKIEDIEHVETVVWYDSLVGTNVPMEILPKKYYDIFNKGDATLMAIFFNTSTSEDATIQAIEDLRNVCGKQCFITGMSALVTDLKNLCEREEPLYVGIAVILACVAMMIFMDSWIIPFVFLISIGMAIAYNLGSNYFLGEISYITKALSAVLQLAVTMDYSIFLWHSYSEQKIDTNNKLDAMAKAISETFTSVMGSSITTIAGFIALCFMTFTLGRDLGIVMAKGVIFGVISCVTILPTLILVLDGAIEKTKHRALLPNMDKVASIISRKPIVFIILFVILIVPFLYGYSNEYVYYDMSTVLPKDMDFVIANSKLKDEFNMASTHMILADSNISHKDAKSMLNEINDVDGIKYALGFDSLIGSTVPEEILPDSIRSILKDNKYQLILVSSEYHVSSDEVNKQITEVNSIIKKYDENAMLIGEAPCTKDLIDVTDRDFKIVSIISIAAIFFIILFVLKSPSLALILVSVIEFAIFINLGIPYYTKTSLPFIAPICISTIQLGATVDYAILMTTRYKKERIDGRSKKDSVNIALSASIPSIIVSAMGFFAATFGVAVYSQIDIISSMCSLMARGALISMVSVILILPSMFMIFDKLICNTTFDIRKNRKSIGYSK